jgi:hypothetical protein
MPVRALPAVRQNAPAIQPKPDGAAKKSIQSVLKQYIPRFIDSPKNRLPWGDFWIRHGA